MAKIKVDGKYVSAKAYRLASSKPAYTFQHLYHHLTSKKEYMAWRGEYPDGHYTDFVTVPEAEFSHWLRRIDAGEAKPEAQLMSEYSQRISREMTSQIAYQTELCRAKRWYKGQRV